MKANGIVIVALVNRSQLDRFQLPARFGGQGGEIRQLLDAIDLVVFIGNPRFLARIGGFGLWIIQLIPQQIHRNRTGFRILQPEIGHATRWSGFMRIFQEIDQGIECSLLSKRPQRYKLPGIGVLGFRAMASDTSNGVKRVPPLLNQRSRTTHRCR